jgi:hypothetical protein
MCYSRIKSQESKDSSGGEELMCAWKEIVVPVSRSVNCHHVIRAAKQQMPKLHTNMLCRASCRSSAQVAKGASSSQAQGAVNGSSAATRLQVAKVHLGHTTYTQCSWSCLPRSSTTTRQQETSRELGHHAPTSIIILLYRQCSICSNDVDTVGPAHSKSIYGRPALQGKDDLMNHVHFLANPNGGCGFVIDIFWYIMHAIFFLIMVLLLWPLLVLKSSFMLVFRCVVTNQLSTSPIASRNGGIMRQQTYQLVGRPYKLQILPSS